MASWFELEVTSEHVEPPLVPGDRGDSWFVLEVTSDHVEPPPPTEEPPPAQIPVYGPFPWLLSKLKPKRKPKKKAAPQNRTLRFASTTPLPTSTTTTTARHEVGSETPLPRSRLVVHTASRDVVLLGPITSQATVRAEVSQVSSTPLPQASITIAKRDYLDASEDLLIILSML